LVCVRSLAQSEVQFYIGPYFSGDATMYYAGPAYQMGVDIPLKGNLLFNGYGHYFSDSATDADYEIFTTGIMLQYNVGKKGKWYIAVGIAYQNAKEESSFWDELIDRSILQPSYRLGYTFLLKKKYIIHPEIFTTGPYNYVVNPDISGSATDLFTLPSVGIRFRRQPKDRANN